MTFHTDEDTLHLSGSSGDTLEVGQPDTDDEVCFSIWDNEHGCYVHAYLGPAERVRLIAWLNGDYR